MKRIYIISSIFLLVIISAVITFNQMKKTNEYVKEWVSYPKELKILYTKIFLEKPIYWILSPEINEKDLSISKDSLEQSLKSGADWIVNMQEETGRFNYWYNPETNKFSSRYDDNFLRQAGTGYSLMLVYEITGLEKYKVSALKNLEYLFQYKRDLDTDKMYFLYKQKAKLGGIALPMLIMLKYRELTGDTLFDTELKKAAEMILYLQNHYGSGKFKSTYVYIDDYKYEENSGWESMIYPGEAMLALVFMYKQFGDEKYLDAIDQAFHYYSKHGYWYNMSFIPWTTSAFSELYQIEPKEEYASFVYKMSNYVLLFQNLNPDRITLGSMHSIPTVFTATWFEGIGDALLLAQIRGDEKKWRKYSERSEMAYQWLLKLQFQDIETVPDPAVGGFRKSLHQPEIRIDNTQHAISAISRGLKYIYKTELKGKRISKQTES